MKGNNKKTEIVVVTSKITISSRDNKLLQKYPLTSLNLDIPENITFYMCINKL